LSANPSLWPVILPKDTYPKPHHMKCVMAWKRENTNIGIALKQVGEEFRGVQPRMLTSPGGMTTIEFGSGDRGVCFLIDIDGSVCVASRFPGHGYAEHFKPLPELIKCVLCGNKTDRTSLLDDERCEECAKK
jgi:hypothetical protein